MGQATSRSVGKVAEKIVKQSSDVVHATGQKSTSKPSNPSMFLRGEGAASHDVRDSMQELYLRQQRGAPSSTDGAGERRAHQEMPNDLLKFIQDVGPAERTIDKGLTSPKLLRKEHEKELGKLESTRTALRYRRPMPLMGEDSDHTTVRNTNFSRATGEDMKDFGVTSMQMFQFLLQKQRVGHPGKNGDVGILVDDFADSIQHSQEGWTEHELEERKELLRSALEVIELPVLRMDQDGNIFGLCPGEVPGPEVKSVRSIPSSKVLPVLQDIRQRAEEAEARLLRRRERKETTRRSH